MNAYDTTDPQKLLQLKRLEADALLDVLKTINHAEMSISNLCSITRNVLRAQLGVKKMAFHYHYLDQWHEGIRVGFRQVGEKAKAEMFSFKRTGGSSSEAHPFLTAIGVEYVVPIANGAAYFLIAEFADSEVEAQNDLIFIETLGNILAVAISNRQLFQEKMDQESLRRELEVAEAIQRQLLISDFSRFEDLDVYAINLAHHRVGGDLYDVIKKENGITFLCIADVAGKGIGAALLMSNLQANLRALCAQYNDLTSIIVELNRILYNITIGEKFVTLFLARVDARERELAYVNAGHNYPLFQHGDRQEALASGCILMGITPEVQPEQGTLSYQAGDYLFAYTDGVVEQYSKGEEEMFGTDRVVQFLQAGEFEGPQDLIKRLQKQLNRFAAGQPATDDITMLGVRFI